MPRTPGAGHTNNDEAITNPTANDDIDAGYEIGSRWTNTVTKAAFLAVDVTAGAAVWKDVTATASGSHPVHVDTVDPTVTDDSSAGFAIGDHWINTASKKIYTATSVSVGAAVWERVDQPKANPSAGADPLVTDDSSAGYEIGSVWTNGQATFVCQDASVGAAIWKEISNVVGAGKQTPLEHFLGGSVLFYGAVGSMSGANVIQYCRVWLTAGLTISRVRVFVDSGDSPSRTIRMGIYSQATATDPDGVPLTRVAQTAEVGTVSGKITTPLVSPYAVTVTGYYWIALVCSTTSIKFAISLTVYRADFAPVYRETTAAQALPASASGLTNPEAVIAYASAMEPA